MKSCVQFEWKKSQTAFPELAIEMASFDFFNVKGVISCTEGYMLTETVKEN